MIVDEVAEQAEKGRVPASLGLRLALAHLHSIAGGPIANLPSRRYVFDFFWHEATRPDGGGNPNSDLGARRSYVCSALQQIGRQIGCDAQLFNVVREAREKNARRQLAEAVRDAGVERDDAGLRKRLGYWGPRKRSDNN